jgi:hypothetical protein
VVPVEVNDLATALGQSMPVGATRVTPGRFPETVDAEPRHFGSHRARRGREWRDRVIRRGWDPGCGAVPSGRARREGPGAVVLQASELAPIATEVGRWRCWTNRRLSKVAS